MSPVRRGSTVLVVGGGGGFVGRALLPELSGPYQVRSLHRHPVAMEARAGVEWVVGDVARVNDWGPLLRGADAVVNLAWYRWGNATRFRRLAAGLLQLIDAARRAGIDRFLQVSVPPAPPSLERGLPYLAEKRRVDRALVESGLSYRIFRPTMLFGPGDRLLGVMLRLMHRYPLFPMFGDGRYHVSPLAVTDLARGIRQELPGRSSGIVELGGPERFEYRVLTDRMFALLGKRPRYWHLGPRGSVALAQLVQDLGSTLLYAYEVEWLLSDRLGLAPWPGLAGALSPVEPYLAAEAARLTGRTAGAVGPVRG
jgi:uncharacterized protein YbjT (DUF2867 family)